MFLLCVWMVYLCGNIIVKLVDIDSGDQLRVWDDVNIEGRPHAFYWRLRGWSFVRSFASGGYSDRDPCKIRKYPYPLYSIRSITVNALLCVQVYSYPVHTIRTFNASFNIHIMLVSGEYSKLNICGSVLHYYFGQVELNYDYLLFCCCCFFFILLLVWMWYSMWNVVCVQVEGGVYLLACV